MSFSVSYADERVLKDVLYDGFELSDAPEQVKQFMLYSHEKCICLDIGEKDYLPCYNVLCLSTKNPLGSFAAFCGAIDENDIFSIRIKLRQASEKLNQYVEEGAGSAQEFLRHLCNIRGTIKVALGKNSYGIVRKLFSHFTLKNNDFSSVSTRKMY